MLFTTVDVETTGLDRYTNDIIQCAYVVTTETGRIIKSECLYFYYPGVERSWSDEAFKVHGIPLEELRKHAEEFETNCRKMWIMLAKSNCVTFNGTSFDVPFIQKWLKRMGFPLVEPYMQFDVRQIFKQHGIKGKLVDLPDKIGLSKDIIQQLTENAFGDSGRQHLAYYDIIATNLAFNYAVRKKWVNLTPITATQVSEDYTERQLDEASGRTLINDIRYYLKDYHGVVYEVALCPDPNKYVYYKQIVTDKEAQFVEEKEDSGIFRNSMICIRVTGNTITLEPYEEG